MGSLKTLKIDTNETVSIGESSFEYSGLNDVVIQGNIRVSCWIFENCADLKVAYYCGTKNPEFITLGYRSCTSSASLFGGSASSCVVKVPCGSKVTKFGPHDVAYDVNYVTRNDCKIIYELNKVVVVGRVAIDGGNSNENIQSFFNVSGCFKCTNFNDIKTTEFRSDGNGELGIPYFTGGGNKAVYLGFLPKLETAIFGDDVIIRHHIFYGMRDLKTVIVNSTKLAKIEKDAFTNSGALTYHFRSDVQLAEHIFLDCFPYIQGIYFCGSVIEKYGPESNVFRHIFSKTYNTYYQTFEPNCVHIPSNSSLTRIDTVQNDKLIRDANIFTINNVNFTFFRNSIDVTGSGSISQENVRSISYSTKCISCNSYNNIESISFNGDVTIGGQAFSGINSLASLTFNNVQIIGERSFKSCDIRTIFMSGDVRQIEDEAFADNANLGLVSFCGQTDPGTGFAGQFDGCPASLNIKVMLSDQNFVGYTGNTFCSKAVEHFYGHEFCGVATFQFTHSSDFSPSSGFTSSNIFLMTNPFSLTNIFTTTKSFTETNHFQNSNYFSKSYQFSMTKQFAKTNEMSKSSIFIATRDFPQSSQFEKSKGFSSSEKFGASNSFSRSSDLSKSNIFSASKKFTPSMFVNQTNYFSPSMTFSKSKKFSSSGQFEKSKMFTKSSEFTSSNQFTKSKVFSSSSKFKESTQFTRSLKFGRTIEFSASSQFSYSLKFTRSAHITASSEFNPSLRFTQSNGFTTKEKIRTSKPVAVESSEVESTFYDDLVNNNPLIEAKSSKGIAIGVSVGVFILLAIIAALIVFFVVCRKKEKVSEEYEGELETEPYSNDETTSLDTSIFDGTTTQDNPIWTTFNPTVDIESSVNFNYEEGYGVFFNSLNKLE